MAKNFSGIDGEMDGPALDKALDYPGGGSTKMQVIESRR